MAAPDSAQAEAFRQVARNVAAGVEALAPGDAGKSDALGGLLNRFKKG
jgi:hypothetical protein